jgi:Zn-dependent protease
MLLVSILIAFLGVFFAAPGAVWHRGYLTKRQSGLIALAGPATNMVLSLIFLFGLVALSAGSARPADWMLLLCFIGFKLNAWIGLFNMIPAGPFDGAKVLNWNVIIFGVTVAVGIVLAFLVGPQTIQSLIQLFT